MFEVGQMVEDEAGNKGFVLGGSYMGKTLVQFGSGMPHIEMENFRLKAYMPKPPEYKEVCSLKDSMGNVLPLLHEKVKSDGGSSDYYKFKVATRDESGKINGEVEVQVQDVIYGMVGADFSLGNILKACRRTYLDSQGGGKAGTDMAYDIKKIQWFAEDFLARFGNKS